jgi:hypothetical protein
MIESLAEPLRALLFTAGGAGLAWLWYQVSPLAAAGAIGGLFLVAVAVQKYGEHLVPTRPRAALTLMETRIAAIAALTAALGAAGIVLTVALATPPGTPTSTEKVIGAASGALVAFLAAVGVSAKDADEAVGNYIRDQFQAVYVREGTKSNPPKDSTRRQVDRMVELKTGSPAHRAIHTSIEFGLTDWSASNRRKRIDTLLAGRATGDFVAP